MNKTAALPIVMATAILPFLELPMIIENMEQESKKVTVRIQPAEIAYYYPGFHQGVICIMKSGSSYLLDMDVKDFDQALAAYHSTLQANPGVFANLSIQPKTKLHAAN